MLKRKPLEIQPEVARQFAANMRAYHAEYGTLRRDEIAADTRHLLLEHMPKDAKLRLAYVIKLFELKRGRSFERSA